MKALKITLWILAVLAALVVGRCTSGWFGGSTGSTAGESAEQAPTLWTCSMHPHYTQAGPGQCPFCGMDLIPVKASDATGKPLGPRQIAMTDEARKLAEIVTAPVVRDFVTRRVRMVGKVDYDETTVRTLSAWVPGRLDRLYVDYTGIAVRKGDHLVWLYSPELLTAQEELLEARRMANTDDASEFLRNSSRRAYESARDKLRLWGLEDSQIDAIEAHGTAEDHVMITSPSAGIVIQKFKNEGDYVQTGTEIYEIADMRRLWIRLDAYEQDLAWLRYGEQVEVQTEAYPGKVFDGWISFIQPVLDERTRTVGVRVLVENPEGLLKPGMFARAVVRSRIASGGRIMDPRLAGKWICPMHPEVVEDGPGACAVCGMDIVPVEELGYVAADESGAAPLIVPVTAVLRTGRRAVVYVEVEGRGQPTFEGREIVLGPRADEHYIVLAGLSESENVVVHGAFVIDSAMQLEAKPSMMSMPGETSIWLGKRGAAFRTGLEPIYTAYLRLGQALAGDDPALGRAALAELRTALGETGDAELDGDGIAVWHDLQGRIATAVEAVPADAELDELRQAFRAVSQPMIAVEKTFGHPGVEPHFEAFCPMAFDGAGALWLQEREEIRNPYLGAKMLRCGEIRRTWPGQQSSRVPAAPEAAPREPDRPAKPEQPPAPDARLLEGLPPVYRHYLEAQRALAGDDLAAALAAYTALDGAVGEVPTQLASEKLRDRLAEIAGDLGDAARSGSAAPDLDAARTAFRAASRAILLLQDAFGHAGSEPYYELYCPMAFGNAGATWLQDEADVHNPYFGSAMPRCGEIRRRLDGREKR